MIKVKGMDSWNSYEFYKWVTNHYDLSIDEFCIVVGDDDKLTEMLDLYYTWLEEE